MLGMHVSGWAFCPCYFCETSFWLYLGLGMLLFWPLHLIPIIGFSCLLGHATPFLRCMLFVDCVRPSMQAFAFSLYIYRLHVACSFYFLVCELLFCSPPALTCAFDLVSQQCTSGHVG